MKLRDFLPRIQRNVEKLLRKEYERAEYDRLLIRRLVGMKDWNAVERGNLDQEVLTLDLSEPRDTVEFPIWGYGFVVQHIDGTAYLRASIKENDPIPLHVVKALAIPFSRVFISNDAQPEKSLTIRFLQDIRANFSVSPTFGGGALKSSFASYESLAAGASATLYSDPIVGTGYLESALVSSAVPVKAEVQTKENGLWTTRAVGISFPGRMLEIHLRGAAIAPGGSFFARSLPI